jgi:hypothetical protein
MTLHSWGAIAPSVDSVDKLISYIKVARPALLRWKRTQILIIDEGTPVSSSELRRSPFNFSVLFCDQSVDGRWAFI